MKIGDYVRTPYGIAKIIDIHERNFVNLRTGKYYKDLEYELDKAIIPNYEGNTIFCDKEDIIKCEEEPIDLIEVGDYINGHRVNYINKDRKHFNISFGDEDFDLKSKFNSDIYWLSKEDIETIVTKEQFASVEYRIGE